MRDERVPVPKFGIGDRVRYRPRDRALKDWAEEESSVATVVWVKLRMFRGGPECWNLVYEVVFDTPWPSREKSLSGSPIRELVVCEESLMVFEEVGNAAQ